MLAPRGQYFVFLICYPDCYNVNLLTIDNISDSTTLQYFLLFACSFYYWTAISSWAQFSCIPSALERAFWLCYTPA